jgi:predicted transcriptional regulator
MAVAFPFDQITSKPGAAINKLQTALNKVIAKLNQKVAEAISKSNILPKTISCSDPRINELKRISRTNTKIYYTNSKYFKNTKYCYSYINGSCTNCIGIN